MDELELVSRISQLYQRADDAYGKYMIQGGMFDFDNFEVIPTDKLDPKNIDLKEAFIHLLAAYKYALALKEACSIYEASDFPKTTKYRRGVKRSEDIAMNIINQGDSFFRNNLEKLLEKPNPI